MAASEWTKGSLLSAAITSLFYINEAVSLAVPSYPEQIGVMLYHFRVRLFQKFENGILKSEFVQILIYLPVGIEVEFKRENHAFCSRASQIQS